MKQTAVEWLYNNLKSHFEHDGDLLEVVQFSFQQAKEMFEQQIIEAGNTCALKQTIHNRKVDLMSLEELEDYAQKNAINVGEEYYKKTYKK